jgi:hypothetical protein
VNLYRVWFGDQAVYWTAEDAMTAKTMVMLWAWRATGRWQVADKVEEVEQ